MGSYKAYIDQGLDLCPKIYLQDEPKSRTQHADHTEPPDDASAHITYERTASSSSPTHTSQDTESSRDYIASSSITSHASQDTRFALATPSSNRTHASQDIQSNPDIFSVSSSNQTRPSQDTQLARSTPTKNFIHASQGDLTTSPNNRNPSNHPSNPLLSHPSHLPEPQSSQTHRSKSKDSEPSPLPTPPQTLDPCPPCAKPLWSKVIRAPPPEPPGPRTPGLWSKALCSSTTPPPAPAPGAIKLEPPRRHGLFSRRPKGKRRGA
ncbi:hypothetical protein V496_08756 [Pseudogymnoascus sp. VKM F-4515 (FW-2607)]|nr:hypothetical protein V496_08756 [Pseudogymnoascus sp. VKM F-4515 (FW-2607)]